ncbi:hypothetical protein ACNSOO_04675 [Aliarcobacter lanthieri]|uniref:hypothetical protein n=1 Tax=Aliarcobacter lanthieri TaxID=1355374 RepID=UPI003AAC31D7
MKKISKHEGIRTYVHDENSERRVQCPDWYFSESFVERLKKGASQNKVSLSRFFETVVQNFFILENPKLIIAIKRDYNLVYKKVRTPAMTIHPQILEDIKNYSDLSRVSSSKYIELIVDKYFSKYKYEIQLKNLLHFI